MNSSLARPPAGLIVFSVLFSFLLPALHATNEFVTTGSLATARQLHTATLLPNGKVLVAGGGSGSSSLSSAELYDPNTGTWTTTAPLAAGRYGHTATLLPNGKVLVAGGTIDGHTGLGTAKLYDSVTGTWSATGWLARARFGHTATLLPNGKVLVAAGFELGITNSAELYDPATGTWSPTGALLEFTFSEHHTATLLPDGRVLVAGGLDVNGNPLASAELYDLDLGFAVEWQPRITGASFDGTGRLVLAGTGFRGISGGSSGGTNSSAAGHPLVELRQLDNGQSEFLLPDPSAPFTDIAFHSLPLSAYSGEAEVTIFTNGIPSDPLVVSFPDIEIEQPPGVVLADGATKDFGDFAQGDPPPSLVFTIRNPGGSDLTGLTITVDGPDASDFTVTASPTAPVAPGATTTFTIEFSPTTAGAKSAAIHIANNVPGKTPYDLNLTGTVLSPTNDTDGDGMNDVAELRLANLGFDWQVAQPTLVESYYDHANEAGLFTTSQIQALHIDTPLIQGDLTTGTATLTIWIERSENLQDFLPFPMTAPQTRINGAGQLEFEFPLTDGAAFFRLGTSGD